MNELKYIPGDLVKADKNPNIIWKIEEVLQNKYWKALYRCVDARNDIYCTNLYKHRIVPIPITPEILEKNGWNKEPSENVTWYKYRTDKSNLYICKDSFNNKDWLVCVALDKHYVANINYVHQLQHLLFGLGLSMDLKV